MMILCKCLQEPEGGEDTRVVINLDRIVIAEPMANNRGVEVIFSSGDRRYLDMPFDALQIALRHNGLMQP